MKRTLEKLVIIGFLALKNIGCEYVYYPLDEPRLFQIATNNQLYIDDAVNGEFNEEYDTYQDLQLPIEIGDGGEVTIGDAGQVKDFDVFAKDLVSPELDTDPDSLYNSEDTQDNEEVVEPCKFEYLAFPEFEYQYFAPPNEFFELEITANYKGCGELNYSFTDDENFGALPESKIEVEEDERAYFSCTPNDSNFGDTYRPTIKVTDGENSIEEIILIPVIDE